MTCEINGKRLAWEVVHRGYGSNTLSGSYEKGIGKEDIERVLSGDFGGDFLSFGDGKFIFVKYND